MKAKYIKTYNDALLNRYVDEGEEFEVTEERADGKTKL